jgi:uncharacterized protein (DUF1015 family)
MIYCQVKKDGSSQVGIFAAVDVEDCINNGVKKHENVTKEEDVTVMNDAKPAKFTYVDPVMLMYRESSTVNDVISRIVSTQQPMRLRDGTAPDTEEYSFAHSGRSRSSTACSIAGLNGCATRNTSTGGMSRAGSGSGLGGLGMGGMGGSGMGSRSNSGMGGSGMGMGGMGIERSRSNGTFTPSSASSPVCGSPLRQCSPALPDYQLHPYITDVGVGEAHYLWPIEDPADMAALQEAFSDVESLYIADGHHRTAAACQAMLKHSNGGKAKVASNRFLTALIFPDSHLSVLPYNRCVKHLKDLEASLTSEILLERISKAFTIERVYCDDHAGSDSDYDDAGDGGAEGEGAGGGVHAYTSADADTGIAYIGADTDADTCDTCTGADTDAGTGTGAHAGAGTNAGTDTPPTPTTPTTPNAYNIGMYLDSCWYKLHPLLVKSEIVNPLDTIDAQILLEHLLYPILGMNDPGSENYMIYGKNLCSMLYVVCPGTLCFMSYVLMSCTQYPSRFVQPTSISCSNISHTHSTPLIPP